MRYAHLDLFTLRESINTLEPKTKLTLNFGHNMDTISKRLEFKEEMKEVKSP